MDPRPGQPPEPLLTVNEQVIVMSGHETIRVLEVGVDTPLPAQGDPKTAGGGAGGAPGQGGPPGGEEGPPSTPNSTGGEVAGQPKVAPASPPPVPPPGPPPVPQLALQAPPQVLAQESLATGVTGVMVPAGTVTQPLLIPISVAGQVAGPLPAQPALVVTIPTATLAALPGLLKPPVASLAAAAVLSPLPAVPAVPAPRAPPPPPGQPPLLPQPPPAPTPPKEPAGAAQTPLTLQAPLAGLAFNPGIVIGTLPWVVAPPGVAAAPPAPPPPSLQVTPVTPQLLLNAQGQVIATLATGVATGVATAATVSAAPAAPTPGKKGGPPETPVKSEVQPIQPAPAGGTPSPGAKVAPTPPAGPETPTVSQLVAKPPAPPGAEEDGINLEEIREFAKNFKLRRLSLGLTQTQVGQALTATEGPAYSQSAICRFEKLDITPKSAQKLKPVLEKWLREAEQRQREGQQHLLDFVGGEPGKKRKRRTSFTPQALEALNAHFERNALPTGPEITRIAQELRYDREVVRVWFCNRRQTLKNTSKLNVFHVP
ncbi:LOW QUALITY PROTEIN: POU domain, class 6, transcription factor 1-like [Manacus candei]|uniref:LOW QUALITY PROTEIN: POU domain, class 6, transcription factor 1-like n=1 Tax=Manacus candei TaxID=415023 RepID=UPI002226A3CD|nr:LOW QUALITY PROTEIN: POU domain, class 6, transcription factor 1-like [Manacus candei]